LITKKRLFFLLLLLFLPLHEICGAECAIVSSNKNEESAKKDFEKFKEYNPYIKKEGEFFVVVIRPERLKDVELPKGYEPFKIKCKEDAPKNINNETIKKEIEPKKIEIEESKKIEVKEIKRVVAYFATFKNGEFLFLKDGEIIKIPKKFVDIKLSSGKKYAIRYLNDDTISVTEATK